MGGFRDSQCPHQLCCENTDHAMMNIRLLSENRVLRWPQPVLTSHEQNHDSFCFAPRCPKDLSGGIPGHQGANPNLSKGTSLHTVAQRIFQEGSGLVFSGSKLLSLCHQQVLCEYLLACPAPDGKLKIVAGYFLAPWLQFAIARQVPVGNRLHCGYFLGGHIV